jgi:hypothetical protein
LENFHWEQTGRKCESDSSPPFRAKVKHRDNFMQNYYKQQIKQNITDTRLAQADSIVDVIWFVTTNIMNLHRHNN